jgi:hypothetical protein
MIPEPQLTYLLELLNALGPAADDFVIAGAQAMKFVLERARATKDFDFVLDVIGLRGENLSVGKTLRELGYEVVEGSRNFQFEKPIPNSKEKMRIELMAPEEFKRYKDFRVDIDEEVHARSCVGGSIAVAESIQYELSGKLPNGTPHKALVRVTQAHALVMLKLLALDDRYRNIRGPKESRHDREEARTHAADIMSILRAQLDPEKFKKDFHRQFGDDQELRARVAGIIKTYFSEKTSPGLLVYEEFLVADKPVDRAVRIEIERELEGAYQAVARNFPRPI